MNITFVGDFKPDYPGGSHPFGPDCKVVANFECSVSDEPGKLAEKAHPIVFPRDSLSAIDNYRFVAVNLANNHIYDAGRDSFLELRSRLDATEALGVFGLNDAPYTELTVAGVRCAIIGALEPCRSRGVDIYPEERVEQLIGQLSGQYDRIFVTPHWGKEGEYGLYPSLKQRQLAKKWAAAGAHAVIGHHSHTVQGREQLGDVPVFYSLGNFCFEHEESREHPLTSIGLAVQWRPGAMPADDSWQLVPFSRSGAEIRALDDSVRAEWQQLFEQLSADLGNNYSLWRWATIVGPVYIPKSIKAWKKRRAKGLKQTAFWLIWSFLPSVLLFKLAAVFPDQTAKELQQNFEAFIAAKI